MVGLKHIRWKFLLVWSFLILASLTFEVWLFITVVRLIP